MGSLCAVLSLQTFKPSAGHFLIPLQLCQGPASQVSLHWEPECQVVPGRALKRSRLLVKLMAEGQGHFPHWFLVQGPLGSKAGNFPKGH